MPAPPTPGGRTEARPPRREIRTDGQLHDRSYTWTGFTSAEDYLYADAVGSAGSPEVTLAEGMVRPGIGLHQRGPEPHLRCG